MPITWKAAKERLSQYAGRGGKCPNAEEVSIFVKEVLQYMLYSGNYGNIRKYCFMAEKGCITLPYELEAPLKVKIGDKVGSVWNRWFDFYSQSDLGECLPAENALYEEPNLFPTVYDVPNGGARVGAIATAGESDDAHIIVQGVDPTGREVFTNHNGKQIAGEYLRLRKGEFRYSTVIFGKITGILKTKTQGYVQLLWVIPEINKQGFLSDYSPLDEIPAYRRFRLTSPKCHENVQVSVIGRIRLKENYADEDLLPFDNLYALSLAGQTVQANYNDDVQGSAAKDQALQNVINKENEYRRSQPGQPCEVFFPLSAGAIKGIV